MYRSEKDVTPQKNKKKGHEVCQQLGHLGAADVRALYDLHIRMNEWSYSKRKCFDSKRCARINVHSPRMTRKLRLFVWALTLQILPLHAQEEDRSNDDIQDPNTPISLVRPFFLDLIFFSPLFFTPQIRAIITTNGHFPPFLTLQPNPLFLSIITQSSLIVPSSFPDYITNPPPPLKITDNKLPLRKHTQNRPNPQPVPNTYKTLP